MQTDHIKQNEVAAAHVQQPTRGNRLRYFALVGSAAVLLLGCASGAPPSEQQIAERLERALPDKNLPIYFPSFIPQGPNHVGGVGVYQRFINPSKKTFKYVLTEYTAQDRVLETVVSDIGNRREAGTKAVGPYAYGQETGVQKYEALWYNGSIKCVTMVRVTINLPVRAHAAASCRQPIAPDHGSGRHRIQ